MSRAAIFARRADLTEKRLDEFKRVFRDKLHDSNATALGEHACIYAVGSAGRKEITERSDLDVFLVESELSEGQERHRLNEIVLQSAVIRSFATMRLPPPSNGAEFLKLHTVDALTRQIGERTDDPKNTFTARMLLLLESRPLIGDAVYDATVNRVLTAYWKNYEGHESDYIPILLINDIVRYWRVLLLNYVAMNMRRQERSEDPNESKRDRRLRSYKLRFSRCLTCYSALAYLLVLEKPGISVAAVRRLVDLCPRERLSEVAERTSSREAKELVDELLERYAAFLETIDKDKNELMREFDEDRKDARFREGDDFGQTMARLMVCLGAAASSIYRYIIV